MQDVTLGERGEVLDGNITQNGHYDGWECSLSLAICKMAERGLVITASKQFQPAFLPCILSTITDLLSAVGKNK